MNDGVKVKGSFCGTLIKEDGSVEVFHKDNLVVNAGKDFVFGAVFGTTTGQMNYVAVGSGTTAAAIGQTALVSELGRVAGTYAHSNGTSTCTITASFAAGVATGAITESGIFSASSSGTMFDRVVFPVINKGANDVYVATFTITIS